MATRFDSKLTQTEKFAFLHKHFITIKKGCLTSPFALFTDVIRVAKWKEREWTEILHMV